MLLDDQTKLINILDYRYYYYSFLSVSPFQCRIITVLCPFPIIWAFHDHSLQSRFYHANCAFPRRQIRAIRYVQELIEY